MKNDWRSILCLQKELRLSFCHHHAGSWLKGGMMMSGRRKFSNFRKNILWRNIESSGDGRELSFQRSTMADNGTSGCTIQTTTTRCNGNLSGNPHRECLQC